MCHIFLSTFSSTFIAIFSSQTKQHIERKLFNFPPTFSPNWHPNTVLSILIFLFIETIWNYISFTTSIYCVFMRSTILKCRLLEMTSLQKWLTFFADNFTERHWWMLFYNFFSEFRLSFGFGDTNLFLPLLLFPFLFFFLFLLMFL